MTRSSPRPARRPQLLRRLVIFAAALSVLSLSGLGLLLFRWWGERGAPPAGRLYVAGEFERGRLATLERDPVGNACFRVEVEGDDDEAPTDPPRVCRGKPLRVWVEDALLDLTIGARGVPRVSIAGLRAREGDTLGSLADLKRPGHPRFPLRVQGVPGTLGRAVACPASSGAAEGGLCLEIHDRLGRLAIVREGARGAVEIPNPEDLVRLDDGDALWLGLVAFVARHEGIGGDRDPALVLDRVDRLRPRRRAGGARASDLGGDRRWLGRLWHVESPDPSAETPERFEILPMRRRYTPHNLSRQRTNLEGEDVLQRLIDGGWLCLDSTPGGPRLDWRPLDQPGCAGDAHPAALTASGVEDYRRARFGDLSYLAGSLVTTTNGVLAAARHLEDATLLPFVFDWRLSRVEDSDRDDGLRRVPQPVPSRLWGVRFGVTRQVRRTRDFGRGLLPTVLPRASTARHLLQVLRDDELLSTFYLPATADHGAVCLGRHDAGGQAAAGAGQNVMPLQPTSGGHHPLGSAAFVDDPRTGTWAQDPDAACSGCRLDFRLEDSFEGIFVEPSGACDELQLPETPGLGAPKWLTHGLALSWNDLRLRYVERGSSGTEAGGNHGPWLAASDPGTGRRHFAEELYLRGRLRPLLGDAAALSGVEAALRELLEDSSAVGVAPGLESLELTVDGDLQLAATAIVDALARPQIAEGDPEPHRVSVTAAILDAEGGDLLAAVNWSSQSSEEGRSSAWRQPTAWELGSGQADVLENAALLRRGAIGSTMKITGSYALLNNDGLTPGPELSGRRRGLAFVEAPVDRGRLYLHRGIERERASRRRCSTGPHVLPASDAGFTTGTFIRRFAASCNNFFVMTGFRHAGHQPATLRSVGPPSGRLQPSRWPADGAGPQQLLVDLRQRGQPTLVSPSPAVHSLAERIRDGLAGDFAAESLPRSLYGILFSLGFQPRPGLFTAQGEAPAELAFEHRAQPVAVPLANDWFSPAAGDPAVTPALKPGRDFSYPGVPSPGRLDEATVRGPSALERYDGAPRDVRRHAEGRADVQWSMLMIGQSSVEASAVGLASLYAPAARADGRAISPCLFRANCGPHRAGARVFDAAGPGAEVLNQALFAVVRDGTARGGLVRAGRRHLVGSGWGGKTGTYEVERSRLGLATDAWRHLRLWACGVDGVARPQSRRRRASGTPTAVRGNRVTELTERLSRAPAGSALGARVCEDTRMPLNPAGVHAYRGGELPAALDELAAELQRTAETDTLIYHSFVTLVPPARGQATSSANPAEGIVIAVLVDRQTVDKSVAIKIGGELAAAVERWAASAR